ncbi:unnamed protein product [Allacma fusca]|uniref:Uncharacterized protein n=1 Tax=Allacma fusca TaxID=39272 RepID=A0A8J2LTT6_9HEXA|nr:unnamed protein product [Allacma fusca]
MPWFGGKKVKPDDEESPGRTGNHGNDAFPPAPKEPRKYSGKESVESKEQTPKEDVKKDQAVEAVDQAFVSSVGVDTSGNLSETKANTPVQSGQSTTELDPKLIGPDPRDIYYDEERPVWDTRFDFLISMIGFALDVSNVWRFPWLCFKHRGLIFLLPYIVVLVLCVFPIFYLELIIGQYVRKGVIGIWRICPIFKGVGYATLLITYSVVYTYTIVLTWTVHYAIECWSDPIPWTTCNNDWNTRNCIEMNQDVEQTQRTGSLSGYEYFHYETLQRYIPRTNVSYSMLNIGDPVDKNYIYLTVVYLLLIIFLIRGMKHTVKVMWYSTGVTVVILTILLFRGVTLPGSSKGLKYLFNASSFTKLGDVEMWIDAASQVLYSTGLGFGVHLTFASLNRFHHYILRDCIIVITANVLASCVSVIAVFGFIGGHAFFLRTEITETTFKGVDTIFDFFPDAMARLPANKFFIFSFFVMIFMLSFSNVLAAFQVVIMGIKDELRNDKNTTAGCKKCVLTAVLVAVAYGLGLVSLTQGGYDIFTLIDDNTATSALLLCVLLHLVGVSWFFGLDNVCKAVYAMYGSVPNIFLRICWKFASPIILLSLIVGDVLYSLERAEAEPMTQRVLRVALGAVLTWFPILVVFLVLFLVVVSVKGPAKCLCLISPDVEHEAIRKVGKGRRSSIKHWKFIGTRQEIAQIIRESKGPTVGVTTSKATWRGVKPKEVGPQQSKEEQGTSAEKYQPGLKKRPTKTNTSRGSGGTTNRTTKSGNVQYQSGKKKSAGTKSVLKTLSTLSSDESVSSINYSKIIPKT